jgi:hypothetical protein
MITIDVTYACDKCGLTETAIGFPEKLTGRDLIFRNQTLDKRVYVGRLTGWEFFGEQVMCRNCMKLIKTILSSVE